MRNPLILIALAVAVAPPVAVAQAPLTLGDAFRRADSAAFANRMAGGAARAAGGQADAAFQGILPTIRAEAGYVRTDNPLAAFGYQLQQRSITMASFDPALLNYPAPVNNWNGGVVAEVPLINVDAWYGRSAGTSAAASAQAQAGWTRESTRVDVARAYFGAVLARERVRTLEAAAAAARANLRQAEAMVTNGLATKSDALLSSVQAGQVEAQLIGARGQADIARERLALSIGQPGDTSFMLPDSLPSAERIRALAAQNESDSASARLDVAAAQLGLEAAQRDSHRATAQYLPRLNGFGRYDWNSPTKPFSGVGSYTVGVMASWSPFAGASEIAMRKTAQGRAEAAQAAAEGAAAGARLEQDAMRSQLTVALAQLGIAETSVAQGAEAYRIVGRKYAGGLATIAELLGAAAVETQTRLGLSDARYQAIVAEAAARQAEGLDLMALTALEN
jgi:outer membrane protein TolC